MLRCIAHVLVLAAILPCGCSRTGSPQERKPVVAVSVLPQATFVRRIAGDLVDVHVMIPPGAIPETYEPTMADLRAVEDAALYVRVGHPNFAFERAWLDEIIGEGTPVVNASAGLDPREGDPHDPHVWVSPSSVRTMAINIAEALSEIMPAKKAVFETNLAQFLDDVDSLDRDLDAMLEPYAGRTFFVFHPAWGYFADEYALEQVAVEHEGKSPSPAHLATTIEAARASGASVILVQPQFPTAAAQIIAEEIGAEVVVADPLAPDWLENTRRVARMLAEAFSRE